jgi:competence protein ComEA
VVISTAGPPASAAASAAAASGAAKASAPAGHASAPAKKASAPIKLVDINAASRKELKTLPGIGDAEADRIIAGRPYLSKAELVAKNVLLMGPYLSVKDRVVALQHTQPKSKK